MSNSSNINSLVEYLSKDISSKRILLIANPASDYDTISSLIGMTKILKKIGASKVDVAFTKKPTGKNKLLIEKHDINYLSQLKKPEFVIKIKYADDAGAEIDDLKWEIDEDTVSFHVVPLKGKFDLDRVTIEQIGALYDITLLFNIVNKSDLDPLFTSNQYLFENLKISVLTNKNESEMGEDVVYNKGEALSDLVFQIGEKLLSKDSDELIKLAGDVLLEGMLSYVELMQRGNTPKITFDRINMLVQAGCEPKTAWKEIYSFESIEYNTLIEKMFSNRKYSRENTIVWSTLLLSDIEESGIDTESFDLGGKLPFNMIDGVNVAFILYEGSDKRVHGIIESNEEGVKANEVIEEYLLKGNVARASFVIPDVGLKKAENIILDLLGTAGDDSVAKQEDTNDDTDNDSGEKVTDIKVVKKEGNVESKQNDTQQNSDSESSTSETNKDPITPPPVEE